MDDTVTLALELKLEVMSEGRLTCELVGPPAVMPEVTSRLLLFHILVFLLCNLSL